MIFAIDPGKSGGIARLSSADKNEVPVALSMPKTDREVYETFIPIYKLLGSQQEATMEEHVAFLEGTVKYAGTAMPGSAGIVYGDSCGFIRGVLTALRYRIVLVPPKVWQKALGLGARGKDEPKTIWKNKLKNRAEQLYPSIKVTLQTADALLILEAARRGLIG